MKLRRLSKNQKEILLNIGKAGLITATVLLAPNALKLFKPRSKQEKYYLKKNINTLYEKDIIYLSGERVKLTDKGKQILRQIEIEDVTISPKEDWDGIWHLVCYDIPETKKKERDYFRAKLTQFGFTMIQDSLWVFPYECREEIAVMSQNLGIAPYVAYLNTDHLPQQSKLVKYYNLLINTK